METKCPSTSEVALDEFHGRQAGSLARSRLRDRARLRSDLAGELEFREDGLLDVLLELGITPDTAPAFEALPLVEVAWADGEVDDEERWRVLAGATAFGLELGRPAHAQLELWLERRPPQDLFDAWHVFALRGLSHPRAAPRARRVLEEAHEVAAAAGGLLGLGAVSKSERATVSRIRDSLESHGGLHVE